MTDRLIVDVLTGGNHLASALLSNRIFPNEQKSYEQVLEEYGQPWADIWIAWKSIMEFGINRVWND